MINDARILGQMYGIDDFVIVPETLSGISSRKECNPYYYIDDIFKHVINNKLPIFAAPMGGVIDVSNWQTFFNNGINVVIPRTVPFTKRIELMFSTFVAVSLVEAENTFINKDMSEFLNGRIGYICIDIANGHMKRLLDICSKIKNKYNDRLVIMTGNIANPKTYIEYAKVGIDYVRCSIGSGNVCTTAANSGIHYPLGSLIFECNKLRTSMLSETCPRLKYKSMPKIIADGGFKNFDQIIKALALGADYVMLGEIFAKSEEACGKITKRDSDINGVTTTYREYYGMSTKKAQMLMGKSKEECNTSEGIVKEVKVEYSLSTWIDNFIHYLRNAMSYTGCKYITEFIGGPVLCINTPMARAAFAK